MRVHWTDRAKQRLKSIEVYIGSESPQIARQVIYRLLKRSVQISSVPYAGREVPEYQQENIREIMERPFRLIYFIGAEQIDILTVMHYRQVLPDDLEKL